MNYDAIVLYDDTCFVCRNFAVFARKSSYGKLQFQSWQDFAKAPPTPKITESLLDKPADKLRVWTGETMLEGFESWEYLLQNHPQLKAIAWAAERMGLQKQTAAVLQSAGQSLKNACKNCGSRRPLR